MARLLISEEYSHGYELDAIFEAIRKKILESSERMAREGCPENGHLFAHVLSSKMKVLDLLNEARNTIETIFGLPAPKQLVAVTYAAETERRKAG